MAEPKKKAVACWCFGTSQRSRTKAMRKGLGKQTYTRIRHKARA